MLPARCLAALLIGSLAAGPAMAEPSAAPVAPVDQATPAPAPSASSPRLQGRALLLARQAEPRLQPSPLPQPVPLDPAGLNEPKPLDRVWFWAAAAGLVLGTAALFLVATSGDDQPSTRLGNMAAFD